MEYFLLIIATVFANNILLSKFLGVCPFLGVSSRVSTSIGMSGAVAFVMTIATLVTYLLQHFVLELFGIEYMQTVTFILVIAGLVQMVEIILKKVSPAMYQALGIFLPLITTNCAVLGVAILSVQEKFNLIGSLIFVLSNALGFGLAMVLFAGLREHLDLNNVPKAMKGVPIALLTASILAMVFLGFSGIGKM